MSPRACLLAALVLGGCGSGEPASPAPQPTPAFVRPSTPTIFMSRSIGEDPMVDDITVGSNRWVEVRRLRGGAGGRFDHYRLRPDEFTRLREAVRSLGPRGDSPPKRADRWYYLVRTDPGEPYQFSAEQLPSRARPAIRLLRHFIDISSQRDPLRH